MKTAIVYVGAAVAEIAGCFAFWGSLRLGKSIWWLIPGVVSLIAFAYLLTLVETAAAGRAYQQAFAEPVPHALKQVTQENAAWRH